MAAFFCASGHLTECHFPFTCAQAGCGHLARYDVEPDEAVRLEAEAAERIRRGEQRPYQLDDDGQITVEVISPDWFPRQTGGRQ